MDLQKQIKALPDIVEIHDIHLCTLDGEYDIFTIHLKTKRLHTLEEVETLKKKIRKILQGCDIEHITIEVEHMDETHQSMEC